jgi:hypothetical protein
MLGHVLGQQLYIFNILVKFYFYFIIERLFANIFVYKIFNIKRKLIFL